MNRLQLVVPWRWGLHLRQAAKLVRVAQRFRSTIFARYDGQIADFRSVLSVISLAAAMGATLEIEVTGEDEQEAAHEIEQVFSSVDADDSR